MVIKSFSPTRRGLFLAFTAMGLVCGLLIGSLGSALAASDPAVKTPATSATLIVVVDQLSAQQPQVHAIWAVQHSLSGTLEWTPLYPATLGGESSQLHVSGVDMHALQQLQAVQQAGLEFSGYFILDQVALDAVYFITGLIPLDLGMLQQAQLIQQACATPWQAEHLDAWAGLIPEHLQSNLSLFELITGWDRWAQAGFEAHCTIAWSG